METAPVKYEKQLSDVIKKLMFKLMSLDMPITGGFLFYNHRTIIEVHFDAEKSAELVKSMIINKENVIKYLYRKYIPLWKSENQILFKNVACIQSVKIMEDKSLYIHIKNSEPHKIITDTFFIFELLDAKGIEYIPEVKYYIETIKVAYQDFLLYNVCIAEFGFKVPSLSVRRVAVLKQKFGNLENVVRIKKRSIKRKFCRYHVKRGLMSWQQLRDIINVTDFSEHNIKKVADKIRNDNRALGLKIDY